MKPDLRSKKLLVLGCRTEEITLVTHAQQLGIYTIVTDNNLDHRIAQAKDYADEYWDISWSDINTLEEKCREYKIDGVISGYSEFRVESNIKLCERLGLPCYCTMEQLEITRNKIKFKNMCRKNGVPVVKEFSGIEDVNEYPVIVKPSDRAGSIGISIAKNQFELKKAYAYAMDMSVCKEVSIERFIYKAEKFDAYYAIVNDEIMLLSTDDVINAKSNDFDKVVQSGWVLPSIHQESFEKKVDPAIRSMIKDMDIHNGYIFFSGFADNENNFAFFECGFRLCGGHLYNYFPLIGKINNMDLFIYYALTGDAECVKEDIYPGNDLKCVTVNVYARKGTIGTIKGYEEVKRMPDCRFCLQDAYEGLFCSDDKAILTHMGRAYFCNESPDKLAEDVKRMYQLIEVRDTDGLDMIYDRIDPNVVKEWWKK